jgi:acyl carrier protein
VVRERILEAAAGATESKGNGTRHPRPDLANPYVAPRNDVEQAVAETWQAVLGLEKVGVHDNFFELGGDSLVAIQVIARLERKFNVHIPPVSIFEGATISKLVETFMADNDGATQAQAARQSRGEARRNARTAARRPGRPVAAEAEGDE